MACHCADGWICEARPDSAVAASDCPGPVEPLPSATQGSATPSTQWVSLIAADDDDLAVRLKRQTRARLKESRQLLDAAKQTLRRIRKGR
jgi:hypothetical protein